jgi:hypothetical protein
MRKKIMIVLSLCCAASFFLSACNLGLQEPTEPIVLEETEPNTPVVEDSISEVQDEPATEAVQHEMIPGELPAEWSGFAGDQDSSISADENRAPGGDRFTFGRYERPFNAIEMNVYHPYIDIQTSAIYLDDTWIYGVIGVKDDDSGNPLSGKYGFEIDLDMDGDGDWLVLAIQPSVTEWTTNGVQVWFDENDDVGGSVKLNADDGSAAGNGYETMVFGEGQGDDPDLAWVRIDPDDPYVVHIAVKHSLIGGQSAFMAGMWAGNELLDPATFDINDRFTHEQAGSSLKEFEFFYPIKSVYELDNACRMAIGFQPRGSEPGLCPLPPGAEPEYDEPTGCPAEYLVCFNFGNQTVCYCTQP